jgi:hypothetical protein
VATAGIEYPATMRRVMKPLIFALCVVFGSSNLSGQRPGSQPSPGHTQVPIWPGTAPDAQFGPPPNTETVPEPGEVDNLSTTHHDGLFAKG